MYVCIYNVLYINARRHIYRYIEREGGERDTHVSSCKAATSFAVDVKKDLKKSI